MDPDEDESPMRMEASPTFRGEDPYDGLQEGRHPRDMDIKLEPEFYTCAFVSPLQLGQKRNRGERVCGEWFFTLAMLFVAAMQCITVFGMSAYLVEKDKGYTDEFKLSTMLFAEGASTIPLGRAQDLCGTFDHIALSQIAGTESLRMPDGTSYSGTKAMPIFHTYKMPSGSWVFTSKSEHESYVDKLLRVLHAVQWSSEGQWGNILSSRVDYGVLFVVMVAILWYHVLFELRKIAKFMFVLYHFYANGLVTGRNETTKFDSADGVLVIQHLNINAFIVGCLCVTMRAAVAFMMMTWGTSLLADSWNKLSLVLNALAIGIVFELDVIVAYAVVDHNTISRIETMQPITIRMPRWTLSDSRRGMDWNDTIFSFVMITSVFLGAMFVRSWQVSNNAISLHNAAALCLFAGPAPLGRQDVLAPVPGFCESLLSVTCGPGVEGSGSYHGPCLVTDQNIFKDRSVMLYADSELFENMYDKNGHRRSMLEWGRPQKKLTSSKTWVSDEYLNLFRRVCVQLYQPVGTVDMRVVDPSIGMTMYSAPFYCSREKLFQAVFGKAGKGFDEWSTSFDLQSPEIVAALDHCRMPPRDDTTAVTTVADNEDSAEQPEPGSSGSPAAAPAVVDASGAHPLPEVASAVALPGKFLRVKQHTSRLHREVDVVKAHHPTVHDEPMSWHNANGKPSKVVHHRVHHEVRQQRISGGA